VAEVHQKLIQALRCLVVGSHALSMTCMGRLRKGEMAAGAQGGFWLFLTVIKNSSGISMFIHDIL
jgi:hypothetical protein